MVLNSLTVSQMQSAAASSDDVVVKNTNVIPSTQQQIQGEFPRYENPNLGISVQHPSDWLLVGESDDKLNFLKDGVAVEIDVDNLDPSDTTLSDYSNERIIHCPWCGTHVSHVIDFDKVCRPGQYSSKEGWEK